MVAFRETALFGFSPVKRDVRATLNSVAAPTYSPQMIFHKLLRCMSGKYPVEIGAIEKPE